MVFFLKCCGFRNTFLKKMKFDLIVSNLLLNSQKKLIKDFFFYLDRNGILVISGILKNQVNERIYISSWGALIFEKKGFDSE